MYCNNCGKNGHSFYQCQKPITSSGIVCFRIKNKNTNNKNANNKNTNNKNTNNKNTNNKNANNKNTSYEYLMICRKDSLGYVEFIRGKYSLYDREYLTNIINEMTIYEKNKLLANDFPTLWNELWGGKNNNQYKNEKITSNDKFDSLKKGINNNNGDSYNLEQLIHNSETNWKVPEWGFPKGRRNTDEQNIDCAKREFEEETGISKNDFKIIENIYPYDEIFIGSNMKSYKHKYFIAYMRNNIYDNTKYQTSEVSDMKWFSIDKCISTIRPYNFEKIKIIKNIDKLLNNYKLIL